VKDKGTMTGRIGCTYTIFIAATPNKVWQALTDPDQSAAWWAHRNVSDWQPGSPWEHRRLDGSAADVAGTVLAADPPTRLALSWANPGDGTPVAGVARPTGDPGPSRVTIEITPYQGIVRLTVAHDGLAGPAERDALAAGWAAVLSNLKTFLETGRPLPAPPWYMLPGFVRE
jgi:uncharacterized protein YndB with AHSA1/START domain